MKKISLVITVLTILHLSGCNAPGKEKAAEPVKIIFDTDLGPDYDDVGALAFLHAMADSGRVEILATVSSNKDERVAPCIEIINNYFGRPGLPIGAPAAEGASMTAFQHWPDSLVARYPHTIASTKDVPDATGIYRRILASQPDTSVTIVTVGFTTNLAGLLRSEPDSLSPLGGKELVIKKVKRLVSMAGRFPEGREFNIYIDSASSFFALKEWPGEIVFTGWEIGSKIFTGLQLVASGVTDSPVRDVFRISIPLSEEDKNGRMSWDETAVLIGVYGSSGFFDTKRGKIIVNTDGSNTWQDDPQGNHIYVIQKMPAQEMATFIEERMMHRPIRK